MKFEIDKAARIYRKTIKKIITEGEERLCIPSDFPTNCCAMVSWLLGRYLEQEQSLTNIEVVIGENRYKTVQRHTWLEWKGMLIDITADQFSWTDRTVFVTERPEQHNKHFKIIERSLLSETLQAFGDDYLYFHNETYDKILNKIKSVSSG